MKKNTIDFNTLALANAGAKNILAAAVAAGDVTTAADLPLVDVGGYYATKNPEAALQQVASQLAATMQMSANLFDISKASMGYTLNSGTGVIASNAAYDTSDYMAVTAGQHITSSLCRRIAVYNASKVFATDYNVLPTLPKTIIIAADGYIRITFEKTRTSRAMVVVGDTELPYAPYNKYAFSDNIALPDGKVLPVETSFLELRNLADPTKVSAGQVLVQATGAITENASYDTFDYMPVTAGDYSISDCRFVCVYDAQKAHVIGYSNNPPAPKVITVAADGYIRVSVTTGVTATTMVERGPVTADYIPYGAAGIDPGKLVIRERDLSAALIAKLSALQDANNPLDGGTLLGFGDSICEGTINGGGYLKIIGQRNNMSVTNRGISGSTLAVRTGYTNSILETVIASTDDADYIILMGGVNDSNSGQVPLGTLSEGYETALDGETFYGAMESLLKTANAKWPSSKKIYMSTHNMNTRPLLGNYMDAAEICCKKWSVPYLDLFHESDMNTNIESIRNLYTIDPDENSTGDGTHPNTLAYETKYVPKIEAKLRAI